MLVTRTSKSVVEANYVTPSNVSCVPLLLSLGNSEPALLLECVEEEANKHVVVRPFGVGLGSSLELEERHELD